MSETVPVVRGDREAAAECRQCGKNPCMWCGGGFWYTSYSGGVAHDMPCDCCNPGGWARPMDIAKALPAEVAKALTEDGAPIPDSLWFGKWSFLREPVPDDTVRWRWSRFGVAVASAIRALGRGEG
jgi:hypothetical protein